VNPALLPRPSSVARRTEQYQGRITLLLFCLIALALSCSLPQGGPATPPLILLASPTAVQPSATGLSPSVPTLTELPPAAPTATPLPTEISEPGIGHPGQIAFWSNRDGPWGIYLIDIDGSNLTSLVREATYNFLPPSWSPDGTRLAYISTFASGSNLMVLDLAAGSAAQLTQGLRVLDSPAWSPDGSRLAFAAETQSDGGEIFTIHADGSGLVDLSNGPDTTDWRPAWSPDGSRIVYQTFAGVEWDLRLIEADGSDPVNLTDGVAVWATDPSWSPDGTRIAFHNGSGEQGEIFLISPEGTGLTNVSNHPADDSVGVWSPGATALGDLLLFYSDRTGNDDLYTVRPDGSGLQALITRLEMDWAPAWSPDGLQIAYTTMLIDGADIFLIDAGGQNRVALVQFPGNDTYPAWRP